MKLAHETQLPLFSQGEAFETAGTLALESFNLRKIREFDAEAVVTSIKPELFAYKPPHIQDKSATSIDDLYIRPEFTSAELQTSLRLLADCVRLVEFSIGELHSGRPITSDEAVLNIQSLLPELFACRGLGDSFGALINCIQNALINHHGMPLTEAQLVALREILTTTRNEPFMRFEKAVEVILAFETEEFVVEPESLQFLTNFFDEP